METTLKFFNCILVMAVNFLFYLISILLIISSILVILAKHPIFSVIFLIFSFILSSFLLVILECEFLALLFIIIYVGAIAILFLFAIMMLESKSINLIKNSIKYFPIGIFFCFFYFYTFII